MPRVADALFDQGLSTLARILPADYTVARSSLPRPRASGRSWLVLRSPTGKSVTCQVLIRSRVEARDVPGLARAGAHAHPATLVLTRRLSPSTRTLLLAAGLGAWDLGGNASLDVSELGLRCEHDGAAPAPAPTRAGVRSLTGEMAGRVVRVLIDARPPYSAAQLAEHARVDRSYVSRLIGFLVESGLVGRPGRGPITSVDWAELLRRWRDEAPLESRGQLFRFACPSGTAAFLTRLAGSGFLHVLTGASVLAGTTAVATPTALLYVDDLDGAVAQFGLRPAGLDADVVLVKPLDRSVFHRSREQRGLRYASPSLLAADCESAADFARALAWLREHEASWRLTAAVDQGGDHARRRR